MGDEHRHSLMERVLRQVDDPVPLRRQHGLDRAERVVTDHQRVGAEHGEVRELAKLDGPEVLLVPAVPCIAARVELDAELIELLALDRLRRAYHAAAPARSRISGRTG